MSSVNFTLNEISDYGHRVEDAKYKALDRFREAAERAEKLIALLEEVITVGENNLKACEAEQEACQNEKDVATEKLNALGDVERHIDEKIRFEEQLKAQAEAQRLAMAHQAEAIKSKPCPEGQESSRERALASLRSAEHAYAAERSKHNDKIYRLRKLKEEIGGYMSELQKICNELGMIESHLNLEHQRITLAIDTAHRLRDDVHDYMQRLERSRSQNIDYALVRCEDTIQKAHLYANEAHSDMCALNDRYYDSYDRIEVRNVAALRSSAGSVKGTLREVEAGFKEMKETCERNGSIMQGRIMSATLAVMDTLSEQEKHSFAYIYEKAVKLEEFCGSLASYTNCKM